jgi:hypothetical protein
MHHHHHAALARIRSEEMLEQARAAREIRRVTAQPRAEQPAWPRRATAVVVATVRRQLPSRA